MKIKSISKHVLAIVLSLAVLASAMMLNTFSVFAEGEEPAALDIWDGTLATIPDDGATHPYAGGNGTAAEPYLISTPEQFAYMLIKANWNTTNSIPGGAHYKLLNDIYLNNVSAGEWYNSANINAWRGLADNDDECSGRLFYGHIHGNGKTVYGLYIDGDYYYSGLIYRFGDGASVEDLRISKAYVNATSWSGSHGVLVGHSWGNTTVKNVVIDDTVKAKAANGGAAVIGGIQGDITVPVTVENCYVGANITSGNNNPRAFLGAYYDNTKGLDYTTTSHLIIKNSYYVGANQLVVEKPDGTQPVKFENCYTTSEKLSNVRNTGTGVTKRTLAEMTGAKAKVYMNAFDFNNVWYTEAGKTPQLRFGDIEKVNATKLWNVWDGTVPETVTYDGGNGQSAATAYEISTAEQLAYLVSKGSSGYYKLTDDIYLNDVSDSEWYNNTPNEWSAVVGANTNFWGTVDGNGHTIYGLYINSNLYFTGLIPRFVGGTISNLRISKSYVKNTGYDGGHGVLVGQIWQNRNVRNCVIDETVEFITAGYGSPLIGGLNDDGANHTGTVNVEGCYVAAKMSTTHADTKPAAFFGKPIIAKGITYSSTASHLVIKNSYYSGEYALAAEKADGPVIYDGCYTTKVYDTENGEKAPAGVTDSSNLEAMKAAGLSAVLAKFSKLGNANGDANAAVDVCDLVTLKKLELGMGVDINIYASDVNNDREINGMDFTALKKYILNDLSVFQ